LAATALIFDKTILRRSVSEPQSSLARPASTPLPNADPTLPANNLPSLPPYTTPTAAITDTINKSNKSIKDIVGDVLSIFTGDSKTPTTPRVIRDLFTASEEFVLATQIKTKPPDDQKEPPTTISLQLSSIIIGPVNRWAVINNEVVFHGQNIGPYRVLEINPQAVILQDNKTCITLFLHQ